MQNLISVWRFLLFRLLDKGIYVSLNGITTRITMSYSETIQENITHKVKLPQKEDLKKAQLRISKFINRTPVLTSSTLDE